MTFGCFAGYAGFDCSLLWIAMIFLFFIGAIFRRQVADGLLSIDFSLIGATVLAEIVFVVMNYITHSLKWSFLVAIVAIVVGGFIGAKFLPDGGGEGGEGGEWF